ncbi:dephospho-CoA kinase [bacterium (Candidatus Blackallbacteria) CG17_big_fil_post_rev_8_21_14_2_50_48_46]|uniref:Dephospho-CoA kinase n=1 Tax=bacterium (Candidatus Blackallbacteria) CG17_big_fil_post_rev_8_21_14_2_50_48_46 TaxID=2014261 RepID=A0A2M7G1E5_9BACT|nr:MAG: dephospho-CoA kinase [bacterium (Candidatus Blackallbacteria) CG18_big_fil_WC_8_21_14_2_50_49_26]PIW15423.1 MAG: dephospho-CoA kinase [bacterium (Candidatus Blackallbacteria) CG17_big_fil_post_rev_8_21_14_2_50_48_46]PIW49716.1 MAG: dephospho-CoA kinase [bacterium (Candidatus Blackallbacteria) CG13_big_fil_rev_8_21_14_2_50_49_14]
MFRIGLTGGIATGKSVVAQMLEKQGAYVIDTDLLAHQLMEPGQPVYQAVVEAFGTEILSAPGGPIDRRILGARIFADDNLREQLNSLVHPAVKEALHQLETAIRAQEKDRNKNYLLVFVIPLLYEVNMAHFVDKTIVVYCPEAVQKERLMARNGFTPEEAEIRIRAQLSIEIKAEKADEVIDNSRDLENTREQLNWILGELKWDRYTAS